MELLKKLGVPVADQNSMTLKEEFEHFKNGQERRKVLRDEVHQANIAKN